MLPVPLVRASCSVRQASCCRALAQAGAPFHLYWEPRGGRPQEPPPCQQQKQQHLQRRWWARRSAARHSVHGGERRRVGERLGDHLDAVRLGVVVSCGASVVRAARRRAALALGAVQWRDARPQPTVQAPRAGVAGLSSGRCSCLCHAHWHRHLVRCYTARRLRYRVPPRWPLHNRQWQRQRQRQPQCQRQWQHPAGPAQQRPRRPAATQPRRRPPPDPSPPSPSPAVSSPPAAAAGCARSPREASPAGVALRAAGAQSPQRATQRASAPAGSSRRAAGTAHTRDE